MRPQLAKPPNNRPFQCFPPSEYLREEMKSRAGRVGAEEWPEEIREVLFRNEPITPERAATIGQFLGTGPEVWLYLQRAWEDWSGK